METSFTKRYLFKSLMGITLLLGITFFYLNHIDFISSAIEFHKMNESNIAYSILQVIGALIIPVAFIIPSMFAFGRIRLAKFSFIAYGICHLLTALWVVHFFITEPASGFLSSQKLMDFFVGKGYVYQITFWDTYTIMSLVFSIIYGVFSIYLGLNFDKERNHVKWLTFIMLVLRVLFPLLSLLFFNGREEILYWITNNYMLLAAQLCFTLAIFIAGSEDPTWIEFVWDQIVFTGAEFDDPSTPDGTL